MTTKRDIINFNYIVSVGANNSYIHFILLLIDFFS